MIKTDGDVVCHLDLELDAITRWASSKCYRAATKMGVAMNNVMGVQAASDIMSAGRH